MKITITLLLFLSTLVACNNPSAQHKLLAKQWDCSKLENVDFNPKYLTPEDSAINAQNEAKAKNLSWQFKNDGTYITSSADIVNLVGKYTYNQQDSILTCIVGAARDYKIKLLTESQLILEHQIGGNKITMHFTAR